jgi:cytochrome c553
MHLPDSLQQQLHALAERDDISIDQLIATALSEKMAALLTATYLEERARRGNRAKYEAALAQGSDVEPEPYDQLPQP